MSIKVSYSYCEWSDREEIRSIINYENNVIPPFMNDMEKYHYCLDVIAETNFI